MAVHAPDLEPAVTWLNTTRALSIKELRGHVVILDFWTYCCINCMHVIPVLREIERRHATDPVVVVGVHSAKFAAESDPARIADAIARYDITHPVVVDQDMGIWDRYTVRSWPTLVVIRPDGTISALAPGEPDLEVLDRCVNELLDEARRAGTLAKTPIAIEQIGSPEDFALRFPGKIAVAHDGRIAISDSGHHRVLVTTADGRVQETIGSGARGFLDGDFRDAAFDDPQGLAWDGETIWLCDTRNHALRRIDLSTRSVSTIAGTGVMAATAFRGRAPLVGIELRSPWDVLVRGDTLYVAMAGSHQIWSVDKRASTGGPFAGSGREALVDGPIADAAFAQPSGLAMRRHTLYVADSETSSVRAIDIDTGQVRTLVGVGLFDFGDRDGTPDVARLQHALGVGVAADGAVVVADTYNDRLRRIDPVSGRVGTLFASDDGARIREPAAIVALPHEGFLVADTGNHRIVRFADDGAWIGELEITGAPTPRRGVVAANKRGGQNELRFVDWFTTFVEPDAGSTFGEGAPMLSLAIDAPDDWKFAADSRVRLALEVSRRSDLLELGATVQETESTTGPVVFTVECRVSRLPQAEVASEVLVTVDAVLCSDGDAAMCVPARGWYRLPILLQREGDGALGYNLVLKAPRVAVDAA